MLFAVENFAHLTFKITLKPKGLSLVIMNLMLTLTITY